MNYKVSEVKQINHLWHAKVEYWEGCRCSSKKTYSIVESDERPSNNDFIKALPSRN